MFSMRPMGLCWVKCLKNQNLLSICTPGKGGSAPSASRIPTPVSRRSYLPPYSPRLPSYASSSSNPPPQASETLPAHPPVMANKPEMPDPGSRKAPRFSLDPDGFETFFKDLNRYAKRSEIEDSEAVEMAIRYAAPDSTVWKCLPCMQPGAELTLEIFEEAVRGYYPGLKKDERYSEYDLKRLLERTRSNVKMTREDLGEYFRQFTVYSTYLVQEELIYPRERNKWYLQGFPQPIRARILQRLAMMKPLV